MGDDVDAVSVLRRCLDEREESSVEVLQAVAPRSLSARPSRLAPFESLSRLAQVRGAAAFALGSLLRDGTCVPATGIPNASERERGVAMAMLPSCADASPLVRHEV